MVNSNSIKNCIFHLTYSLWNPQKSVTFFGTIDI